MGSDVRIHSDTNSTSINHMRLEVPDQNSCGSPSENFNQNTNSNSPNFSQKSSEISFKINHDNEFLDKKSMKSNKSNKIDANEDAFDHAYNFNERQTSFSESTGNYRSADESNHYRSKNVSRKNTKIGNESFDSFSEGEGQFEDCVG